MAVKSNWSAPLEESLLKLLSRQDLNDAQIRRVQQIAGLLDGAGISDAVGRRISEAQEKLDRRYEDAVRLTRADSISDVENGMRELEKLGEYRECAERIEEARGHIEALKQKEEERSRAIKKRKILISCAAAAAAIIVCAVLIVRHKNIDRMNQNRIAEAQTLADAGKNDDAIDAVTEMVNAGLTGDKYPRIYAVTETVLEHTVSAAGFDAAFDYAETLRGSIPDAIRLQTLEEYAVTQLDSEDVPLKEKWDALMNLKARDYSIGHSHDGIAEEYLAAVPADEAENAALEAVEAGLIQSDSDIFASAYNRAMAQLPAVEAWERTLDYIKDEKIKENDDVIETAISRMEEDRPAGEVWGYVADAVENGVIKAKDDGAVRALSNAVKALPKQQAWEAARQGAELKVVDSDDKLLQDAFADYVNSVSILEAWPIVYEARKNKTLKISDVSFKDVYRKYVSRLSVEAAWEELQTYKNDGMLNILPMDSVSQVAGAHLSVLEDRIRAGESVDAAAWMAEQTPSMETLRIDPDSALRLLYVLNEAGQDAAGLFPDGILIYFPIASKVCDLREDLINGKEPDRAPDMMKVLPVFVAEKDTYSGDPIYNITSILELTMENDVKTRQEDEACYEVRLLPEYLFRLPEASRPASMEECGSLLCMQNTYFYTGNIYHHSTLSRLGLDSVSNYRPYYSALDMIAIYETAENGVNESISVQVHEPKVQDHDWFEKNKDSGNLFTAENMLGSFDNEKLREDYDRIVDEFELVRLLLQGDLLN